MLGDRASGRSAIWGRHEERGRVLPFVLLALFAVAAWGTPDRFDASAAGLIYPARMLSRLPGLALFSANTVFARPIAASGPCTAGAGFKRLPQVGR